MLLEILVGFMVVGAIAVAIGAMVWSERMIGEPMEEQETEEDRDEGAIDIPRTVAAVAGDFVLVESTDKAVWLVNFRHVTDLNFSDNGNSVEIFYRNGSTGDFKGPAVKALYDRMVCEPVSEPEPLTFQDFTPGETLNQSEFATKFAPRAPGPLASHEIGR